MKNEPKTQVPLPNNRVSCCGAEKKIGGLGFTTFWFCHELCKQSKVHASFETSATLKRYAKIPATYPE